MVEEAFERERVGGREKVEKKRWMVLMKEEGSKALNTRPRADAVCISEHSSLSSSQ